MRGSIYVNGDTPARLTLRRKHNLLALPFKLVGMAFGAIFFLAGVAVCCTIVGIPVGFLMCLGAFGIFQLSRGMQRVSCPTCRHKRNYVRNGELNFTCRKCRHMHIIDWE